MNSGLLISHNAVKEKGTSSVVTADMVRINTAWYTWEQLLDILKTVKHPKFIDVHSNRQKAKIASFDYENLLKFLGSWDVEWIGISKVEEQHVLQKARAYVDNKKTKICAKIESIVGCENILKIMEVADGIMVDTEDLASEIGWDKAIELSDQVYKTVMNANFPWFKIKGIVFEFGNINRGKTIYTYGVFDLMHPGHINILEKAKELGSNLVVGVVGDAAVAKLKGHNRPIQNQAHRIRMISSLKCVDSVIPQTGYDPVPNMEAINPDILVKGDDWDHIPGQEWITAKGKQLVKPAYSSGYSTSDIIKKIQGEKE